MVGVELVEEEDELSLWFDWKTQFQADPELEKFVERILRSAVPKVRAVDTRGYDSGHGNLHCATLEFRGC